MSRTVPRDVTSCCWIARAGGHRLRRWRRLGTGWIVVWLAFVVLGAVPARAGAAPVYLDPQQPLDARIADLLSRLTLDEKAALMKNEAEGVPRLGLPKYDWWNEALHGVARAGDATVFPQATGLAATWDAALVRSVGDVISTEARAKYYAALRNGTAGERYHGLTFWTPNINLFRDPRWGRGQETYGEDPFLTGAIGVAFVRGLQGDDSRYLKVAACAKHFAVHSGPEATRYHVDVQPPEADLYESYLPAFETLVRQGRVEAVMTAYNALYGIPSSMNPLLFGLLRRWNFDGHVVCDCGAVYCIYEKYGIAKDFPEAEAFAVKAGLSLRCGSGDAQLAIAVRRGLLTEAQLDAALGRLLRTQFRLGFFDPAGMVPYAKIPPAENNTPAHAALAEKAARESIVLLKNDGTLPLTPEKLHRVLVVGPNADSAAALLGNYHGTPTAPVTVLAGLRQALGPRVLVDYAKGCDYARRKTTATAVPRTALSSGCGCEPGEDGDTTGLTGEYFANADLAGPPAAKRRDHEIDFAWEGKAPAPGIAAETFSARWNGTLTPTVAGDYRFTVAAHGGVRLYLGDRLVLDAWSPAAQDRTVTVPLKDDATLPLRLEYVHTPAAGPAAVSLRWTPPADDAGFAAALEKARAADAIVFVGGISAQLEGEDMRVDYEGFEGGDRTRIELPDIQQRLIGALVKTKKPFVFVNFSGGAVAFPSVHAKANAVLQAWYPGQAGGTAVADVLLGRTNPAGRLPVTFYRATADLPAFADYHMANRTYRYFTGQPMYPFGHGLSYTRFKYGKLRVKREQGGLVVSAKVTNGGKRDGDEVVQVYLQEPAAAKPRAQESLAGFARVHLARGASQTVTITVPAESLRRWSAAKTDYDTPHGEWQVLVGASSADIRLQGSVTID